MAVIAKAKVPWQARLPFFYGWVIVGLGFLLGIMGAGLNWVALGVFAEPMQRELGWSRAALFSALTIRSYLGALTAPFIGRYFDRPNGARLVSLCAGIGISLTMLSLAFVTTHWQFLLMFGVVAGIAAAGQVGEIGALVPKWFIRKRGTSMALATLGSASAAFVLPPVLTMLIDAFGWRGGWAVLAVLAFVLTALPALLIVRQPEDVGLLPDGEPAEAESAGLRVHRDERSFTLREALRTKAAWLLLIGVAAGGMANAGLPGNMILLLTDSGLTSEQASLGLSLYGLGSILGRFGWAIPANRLHVRWVLVGIVTYGACVTPLLTVLQGDAAILYPLLLGFGIGGYVGFNQLIWAAYFGRAHLGAINGVARVFHAIVGGAAPLLIALSSDYFHSPGPGLALVAGAYALAAVALLLAREPGTVRARMEIAAAKAGV